MPPLWEAGLRIGGPDAEYKAAAEFLCAVRDDKTADTSIDDKVLLLDLSCGTGFVGKRFAEASNACVDHVFALDYSPQMLGELKQSLQRSSSERSVATNIYHYPR